MCYIWRVFCLSSMSALGSALEWASPHVGGLPSKNGQSPNARMELVPVLCPGRCWSHASFWTQGLKKCPWVLGLLSSLSTIKKLAFGKGRKERASIYAQRLI